MARSRSGHDRSAEVARHREGQAVRSQRRDESRLSTTGIREAQTSLEAKYDAGLPPFFEGTHWTYPAPPELVRRQRPTLQTRTTIRSMPAASPTAMPISASSGWAPASSI